MACHRNDDQPAGYPSLFRLSPEKHQIFTAVVLNGVLAYRGMPAFHDVMNEKDVKAIQAYLIQRSYALRKEATQTEEPSQSTADSLTSG